MSLPPGGFIGLNVTYMVG